ncbi:MAG: hypothetical protein AB7I33_14760 [Gemmatimonadales bacterium]
MSHTSLQDLRRIADSISLLKGQEIIDTAMRSDFRQLKIELSGGLILVVAAELDELGKPRLELDVVRQPDELSRQQLEVRFEA